MNEKERKQRFVELSGDDAFVKKFAECKTPEAALALFAEEGVDLTLEQLQSLLKALTAAGELEDDLLEDVAGGDSQDERMLEEMLKYSRSSTLILTAQEMLRQSSQQTDLIRQLLG